MPPGSIYERYQAGYLPPEDIERSLWFVFHSGKLLVDTSSGIAQIPFSTSLGDNQFIKERGIYLGLFDGQPCFCGYAHTDNADTGGLLFEELRSLFGILDDSVFLLAERAMQIIHWDRTSQFCGQCGSNTQDKGDERAKICPQCGLVVYPRISPAVIAAVLRNNQILLAHSPRFRNNMYSLIAGFVEPGETLEDCVKREILEEVGIQVKNIRYFSSQPWPFPDSLMIGFFADYDKGEISVDGVEITDAAWFGNGVWPELPSKLSIARRMIDWFIKMPLRPLLL